MKKSIIIILLIIPFLSFSQKRKSKRFISPTPPIPMNCYCIEKNKYSVKQRLRHYPFSKASKVEIVSFEPVESDRGVIDTSQVIKTSKQRKIKPVNIENLLLLPIFRERKTLDSLQINKLTQILYNQFYICNVRETVKCYEPHNAILFYDKDGNLIEYLEICFSCSGIKTSNEDLNNLAWCNEQYNKLKLFIASIGVVYGTKDKD